MKPSAAAPGRIGIVEDDPHLRDYLRDILGASDRLAVDFAVGCLSDARQGLDAGCTDRFLVDLQLPDGNGADFVRQVKAGSSAKCLILTVLGDRTSVLAALQSGADGYLLKDTAPPTLVEAVISTLQGDAPISPQAAKFLIEMYRTAPQTGPDPAGETGLTARELEVLKLFSRGLSYREAASVLTISQHTIRDYVKTIYRKLSVHSRSEAVFEARQLGMISPLD